MAVLVPKGGEDFRGIGIMEVLWKADTVILDRHFMVDIGFHDTLHGFRAGHGMRTTSLESNLLQQMTAMKVVIYEIFWASRSCTIPWTGTGACISWQATVWDPEK